MRLFIESSTRFWYIWVHCTIASAFLCRFAAIPTRKGSVSLLESYCKFPSLKSVHEGKKSKLLSWIGFFNSFNDFYVDHFHSWIGKHFHSLTFRSVKNGYVEFELISIVIWYASHMRQLQNVPVTINSIEINLYGFYRLQPERTVLCWIIIL